MRTKHAKCPNCGATNIHQFISCHDHLIGQESFEIDTCQNCQLLFTQPIIPAHEIGAYYQSQNYVSHSNTQKGFFFRAYHWARQYMLGQKFALVQKHCSKKGAHLDIGAGTGYFVQYMQKKGWQSTGVEISPEARNFAKQEHAIALQDPEDFYAQNKQNFDVVTLWHVLEHLEDKSFIFKYIHQHLSSSGHLIIAVPNPDSYDASHYGKFWAAYDVPRHLWHFKPLVLKNLAKQHGFSLVETRPMPLDTFYVSMLSEKYQGGKLFLPLGAVKSAYFILKALFNKEKSSSLIYIFKK